MKEVWKTHKQDKRVTKLGTILLVEDEPNDVAFIRKALAEIGVANPLHAVHSGRDAVKYLSGHGKFADRTSYPLPALMLLDLKMPDDDGFAVLRWLHERPGLRKQLIVIVLTAIDANADIKTAYELGAQSYLVKPFEYHKLFETLRCVKEYWLDLNRLPGDGV